MSDPLAKIRSEARSAGCDGLPYEYQRQSCANMVNACVALAEQGGDSFSIVSSGEVVTSFNSMDACVHMSRGSALIFGQDAQVRRSDGSPVAAMEPVTREEPAPEAPEPQPAPADEPQAPEAAPAPPESPQDDAPTTAPAAPAAPETPAAPTAPSAPDSVEVKATPEILALVNDERAKGRTCGEHGYFAPAPALSWNADLAEAAMVHSSDMVTNDFFSHTGHDGSNGGTRVARAGYAFRAWGENISIGRDTPEEALNSWLNSPPHCKNIMNPKFTEIGTAYAVEAEQDGAAAPKHKRKRWTMNLGKR